MRRHARQLPNEWYILLYHNVSWEENSYLRGLGGTLPPDVLREHLAELARHGELVSIREGLSRVAAGRTGHPLFSLWFDDGFSDVRTYAKPLLDLSEVTGALSVCSRFVERSELFWRMKLSYLADRGALTDLRRRLGRYGYPARRPVRNFVMDSFSKGIVEAIDATYNDLVSETARSDAFRMFETVAGLRALRKDGWIIANHSAAHYPVGERTASSMFADQFGECEAALERWFGEPSKFWVLPFDRDPQLRDHIEKMVERCGNGRYLVLVGSEGNRASDVARRTLHRVDVPLVDGKGLIRHLGEIRNRSRVDNRPRNSR
jgi:peptidoglycan/xylan/chitin deacetylase (PgdA/CDA1 family)